jgi:hypothetical protein
MILGIDPGKNGAMCVKESDGSLAFFDCPLNPDGTLDYVRMVALVAPYTGYKAVIEEVAAFGMGVTSAFNFGRNFSAWVAICTAFNIDITYVRPHVWSKALGKVGKDIDKYAGLELARNLYPQAMPYLKRKKDQDRADALLLIHWYENFYNKN